MGVRIRQVICPVVLVEAGGEVEAAPAPGGAVAGAESAETIGGVPAAEMGPSAPSAGPEVGATGPGASVNSVVPVAVPEELGAGEPRGEEARTPEETGVGEPAAEAAPSPESLGAEADLASLADTEQERVSGPIGVGPLQFQAWAGERQEPLAIAQTRRARRAAGLPPFEALRPASVRSLAAAGDSGFRLAEEHLAALAPLVGGGIGDVRIHTGRAASETAEALGAEAFTVGRDVFFAEGGFIPNSPRGRALLAHELVHVRQQTGPGAGRVLGYGGEAGEGEAEAVEQAALSGGRLTAGGLTVSRYVRNYLSADGRPLAAGERARLDDISLKALEVCRQSLGPELDRASPERIETLAVDVALDLAALTDEQAAQVWGNALAEAIRTELGAGDGTPRPASASVSMKPNGKGRSGREAPRGEKSPEELSARVDEENTSLIIFSRPVTLDEAKSYLWKKPPDDPKAIKPDAKDAGTNGRYTRFLVDVRNNLDLALSMQHGLAEFYLRRARANIIRSKAPPPPPLEQQIQRMPAWVPDAVRKRILELHRAGEFKKGLPQVYTFPGEPPWGPIVVWVGPSEFTSDETVMQVYQYYPEELGFYEKLRGYSKHAARLHHFAKTVWNKDMKYYVEGKKMRPSDARSLIQEQWAEIFRQFVGAVGMAFASAGGLRPREGAAGAGATLRRGIGGRQAPRPTAPRGGVAEPRIPGPSAPKVRPVEPGVGGSPAKGAPVAPSGGAAGAAKGAASAAKKEPLFYKPKMTATPKLPAGHGETNKFGDVLYSSKGTAKDINLARFHEKVHSFLSPKLRYLRNFRADLGMAGYGKSQFLKYLEEAMAEAYAQVKVARGVAGKLEGLLAGIRFPIRNGYCEVSVVVAEGAVGTIVVGGVIYGVYMYASSD